jgi:hypothetical protein
MTQGKILLAAFAAAVTLIPMGGVAEAASAAPSWSRGAVLIAGNEAEDSAKMGKEEGTHTGPNQGATPENETQKVDQPERRNPTTGNDGKE